MANKWGNNGNGDRFYFLGLQKSLQMVTAATKNKRCLLLGRKVMANLDAILKRDITLPTKVRLVKAMIFPVVMYGCESWTIKKTEHQRTDAFELWCWRRLLRVTWTTRRSNQSTLKEINPEYSLEGLMLKLNCQYFGHLMQRADSLEKTLMLEKIEGRRRRGWQSQLNGREFEQAPGDGKGQRSLACCSPWGHKELGTTERLNNNNTGIDPISPASLHRQAGSLPVRHVLI